MVDESLGNPTEQFWLKYLKSNPGKKEINKIQRLYPEERSILIPLPALKGEGSNERWSEILNNPGAEISCIEWAYSQLLTDKKYRGVHVRFTNLPKTTQIATVRLEDENKLIAIHGIIKKSSEIYKRCTVAAFKCAAGHVTKVNQGWGQFREPTSCSTSGCALKRFDFVPGMSTFEDFQRLMIQETNDNQRGGDQPKSIKVEAVDDLCGKLFPGDVVTLNGSIKSFQIITRGVKSVDFGYFLSLNSFDPVVRDYDEISTTEEELNKIKDIAKHDPLSQIAASIAPSIYGMGDVKRACALHLVGGNSWQDDYGHIQRGDIHLMLCMDPGVAKSELLRQVVKLSNRGIYVNAKTSTAAGLTVTVTKDEVDKHWTAEAGAVCLADRGTCAIDEGNHLPKGDQAALHEVMEGQKVSVAKAGLVCSLNARTGIIFALNPKMGRFDMFGAGSLLDQVDIYPPLLSRFDLIFLKSDSPSKEYDEELAKHISRNRLMGAKRKNKTITEDEIQSVSAPLSPEFLRKYFSYCKTLPAPELSPEAAEILDGYYVTERAKGTPGTVPLTARTHEAGHRIAEAAARLELSKIIKRKHAETALTFLQISLAQVATDPKTGKPDQDRIAGTPKGNRDLARDILGCIGELTLEVGNAQTREVYQRLRDKKIAFADVDFDRVLDKLKASGDIMDQRGFLTHMQEHK